MIEPKPGPWIPEEFRTMFARDEHGVLHRIDQETWEWVPVDNRPDQLFEQRNG